MWLLLATGRRKTITFFFHVYTILFTLIFGLCHYGKQESSEAHLLIGDKQTDYCSLAFTEPGNIDCSTNTDCVQTIKNSYKNTTRAPVGVWGDTRFCISKYSRQQSWGASKTLKLCSKLTQGSTPPVGLAAVRFCDILIILALGTGHPIYFFKI